MPLLSKTKVTKTLPAFFFGSKPKRRNSKTITEHAYNDVEAGKYMIQILHIIDIIRILNCNRVTDHLVWMWFQIGLDYSKCQQFC